MTEIERCAAIEAIRQAKARYWRGVDYAMAIWSDQSWLRIAHSIITDAVSIRNPGWITFLR